MATKVLDPTLLCCADHAVAINTALATTQGTVKLKGGVFTTASEIVIRHDRVRLVGDGINQTIINYTPTANGSCIKVSNGAAINFQSAVSGLTITSQDTTYTKVALDVWDVSEFQASDISIAGANGYWRGAGSIGIRTQGREFSTFKNLTIFAEKPLQFSNNPNHAIDLDHFHFEDTYLAGYSGSAYPLITADSGINITNLTFDGAQPWVGGAGGFYWADTASSIASYALTFKNVRTEQTTNSSSWAFYMGRNQSLYSLRLENVYVDPNQKGLYLRNCYGTTLDNFTFTGSGVALDANGTNWGLDARGCFFLGGSTVNLTSQNIVAAGPKYPTTAPLPSAFRLHNAALSTQTNFTSASLSQPFLAVEHNAVAVLGFGTMKGVALLTSSAGQSALYSIPGGGLPPIEMSDPSDTYSATPGMTPSSNVYWSSNSGRYVLENKSGGPLKYSMMLVGAYEGF